MNIRVISQGAQNDGNGGRFNAGAYGSRGGAASQSRARHWASANHANTGSHRERARYRSDYGKRYKSPWGRRRGADLAWAPRDPRITLQPLPGVGLFLPAVD